MLFRSVLRRTFELLKLILLFPQTMELKRAAQDLGQVDRSEIGFQQISELLPVPGVDFVGPLPGDAHGVTVFSAGVAIGAKEPDTGRALIKFLAAPAAAPVIRKSGLEPVTR